MRAAVVGGGAYVAGRSMGRRAEQNQRIDDLEQQQAPAAPAAPDPGATSAMTDQLSKLAALHTQGVLTDDEFAAAKAKTLGN
jgi:hypothetical protein